MSPRRTAAPLGPARGCRAISVVGQAGDQPVQSISSIAVAAAAARAWRSSHAARRSRSSGRAEREHEDRMVGGPLEQVVDELEQAGVGPLHVLEDEDDRAGSGHALEEQPPAAEQVGTIGVRAFVEPSSAARRGSTRWRSRSSGTYSSTVGTQLRARRRRRLVSAMRARGGPSRPAPSTRRPRRRPGSGRGASRTSSRCRRVLDELPSRRDSPKPAWPDAPTLRARPRRAALRRRGSPELAVPAHERRPRGRRRADSPTRRRPHAAPATRGRAARGP